MTDEEIYKIVLKIEGEQEAKKLAASAALAEQKFQTLYDTLGKGHSSTQAAAKSWAELRGQIDQVGKGSGIASHKIMQLGQTLDDMQYVPEQGLRPVINNIMQLSPALGMAMIAVQLLYTQWDNLSRLFGGGHVKTQAEDMEELRKKTSLTADEAERLARATAVGDKVKELRAGQTDEQRKTEDAVSKAIVEAGTQDVVSGVLKVAPELVDAQGVSPQARADVDNLRQERDMHLADSRNPALGDEERVSSLERSQKAAEQLAEAEKKLLEARRKTAEELAAVGALPKLFPGGRKQLADLVEKDPMAFGKKGMQLRSDLKDASPEAREAKEQEAAEAHAEQVANQNMVQRAQSEAKEKDRVEKDLEKEDKEFERDRKKQIADNVQGSEMRDAEAKHTEDVRKQKADKKLDDAKKIPGVEDAIRAQLLGMGGGRDNENALARQLAPGVGGIDTALRLVREQGQGVNDQLMSDFIKGPDRRASSVIGAADLASSIQSSVGKDDTAGKQLAEAKRAADYLERLVGGRRGGGDAAFDNNGNLRVN